MTQINATVGSSTPVTLVATSIQEIIDKVTAQLGKAKAGAFTPLIQQYGPAFLQMGAQGITDWIQLAAQGDQFAAYQAILKNMSADDVVAQWGVISEAWKTQNAINAQAVAFQKNALAGILKGLVQIALVLVGL